MKDRRIAYHNLLHPPYSGLSDLKGHLDGLPSVHVGISVGENDGKFRSRGSGPVEGLEGLVFEQVESIHYVGSLAEVKQHSDARLEILRSMNNKW